MFRKLRLQFILTNLAIITALFMALTAGAYIILEIKMTNNAELFAKRMAEGINSGLFPENPPFNNDRPPDMRNKPFFDFDRSCNKRRLEKPPFRPFGPPQFDEFPMPSAFVIKTNPGGEIIPQPSGLPKISRSFWDWADLKALTRPILKTTKNSGIINLNRTKYFYYKTQMLREPGMLLVFLDLKREQSLQRSLVVSLIGIGIIFLILAAFGSLYMAKRAVGPIQKAWQQQKDFLADASHQLRTPLAVIQTNLEVVLSNPRDTVENQMEWLDNINEELRQMTQLVTTLLFLARVDAQRTARNRTPVLLNEVAARVAESFKPVAAAKNIALRSEIAADAVCQGDESQLRQVIEILLDNAIQHMDAGGEIVVSLHPGGSKLWLMVADTGEGIAAEHLQKIFDRFYQVDASRSQGLGLGLSIAKSIVENHGGTIKAVSAPGSGATFIVGLPAAAGAAHGDTH